MNLLRHIRLAFQSPAGPSQALEARVAREGAVRQVVSRVARGNIRLQRGEYDTEADIEAQYEQIRALDLDR